MKLLEYFSRPPSMKGFNKVINELPNSFGEAHIDVREYLEDGIFVLKNGDLGIVYKLNGIYDEPLTNKELETTFSTLHKGLRGIVCGVPSHESKGNTVVSVHLSQRRARYNEHSKLSTLENSDLKNLLLNEEKYLYESQEIVKRDVYMSIRYCVENKDVSILDKFKAIKNIQNNKIGEDLNEELKLFKTELENLKHNFSRFFKLKLLNSYDYIFTVQNLLSGGENHCAINSESNIHENIYVRKVSLNEQNVTIGGNKKGIFYLEHLPEEFNYGQMRLFLDSIPCTDFDATWILSHGSSSFGADLAAKEGWFSGKSTRIKETGNLQSFRENISNSMPYCVQSLRVLTHNLLEEQKGALQSLSMDYLGSRLQEETQIPIHILKSSLPLCCMPSENKIKGRHRKVRLENAIAFCPLFQNSCNDGYQLWISRSMQESKFDLFAGQGNKMTALLAMSRGGKSVFNTKLLIEFMARHPEGVVRVIDKKSSYQKLSDLVKGRVVYFNEESLRKSPYSPFALEAWDEDDIENLYLLISTALVQKNEGIKLTACHSEILRESLKLAYNNHFKNMQSSKSMGLESDPHPVWNDILSQMPTACENLRASGVKYVDDAKDDLSKWSVNLYDTGQYGFIFSAHEKQGEKKLEQFLTYDLDGISDPVLAQVSAMMAFIKIGRDLAKLPRSVPKLIVFEELGMLLHGDGESQKLMDEFIHMVIKTCAKMNAQAIAITNDVKDYTEKPAGRTIWGNSTQKLFLPLGDLYSMAEKAWSDQFNEADLQIMKSLEKQFHLKRSQAYICSNNEVTPFRGSLFVPLSPYMNAVCTTSGNEVEYYNQLRNSGKSAKEAMDDMAINHPFGENL